MVSAVEYPLAQIPSEVLASKTVPSSSSDCSAMTAHQLVHAEINQAGCPCPVSPIASFKIVLAFFDKGGALIEDAREEAPERKAPAIFCPHQHTGAGMTWIEHKLSVLDRLCLAVGLNLICLVQ